MADPPVSPAASARRFEFGLNPFRRAERIAGGRRACEHARPSAPVLPMSTLHRASGRWRLGLSLTLLTALCWATLPIALKITLEQLDPITLTWFRFAVAALGVGGWL
ncbi:EamA family transporter, partial [Acinetobacter baumannii]